jgi:hypothetical protein
MAQHDPWTTVCVAFYLLVLLAMFAAAFSKPAQADPEDVRRHRRRRRPMRPDRAVRRGHLPRAIARFRRSVA